MALWIQLFSLQTLNKHILSFLTRNSINTQEFSWRTKEQHIGKKKNLQLIYPYYLCYISLFSTFFKHQQPLFTVIYIFLIHPIISFILLIGKDGYVNLIIFSSSLIRKHLLSFLTKNSIRWITCPYILYTHPYIPYTYILYIITSLYLHSVCVEIESIEFFLASIIYNYTYINSKKSQNYNKQRFSNISFILLIGRDVFMDWIIFSLSLSKCSCLS